MERYDLISYIVNGSLGFGFLAMFDTLIMKKDFFSYGYKDGLVLAFSIVLSEFSVDVLSYVVPIKDGLLGYISRPLLTSIFYMYMFDQIIRPNFYNNPNNNTTILISGFIDIIVTLLSNTLVSWIFGIMNK